MVAPRSESFRSTIPSKTVGGLRSSLRAASWQLSARLYRRLFPAPGECVPHTQPLALPEGALPEGAREDLAFELPAIRGNTVSWLQTVRFPCPPVGRRTEPECRSKGSFSPRLPEESAASLEDGQRQDRCSLREPSMALLASRSRGALHFEAVRSQAWYNSANKAVRRTPRLQRTLEAFSRAVACGRWWLRGQLAACNRRTLRRQTLAGLRNHFCFLEARVVR